MHVRSEPVALIPVEGRTGISRGGGLCRCCSLRLAGAAGERENDESEKAEEERVGFFHVVEPSNGHATSFPRGICRGCRRQWGFRIETAVCRFREREAEFYLSFPSPRWMRTTSSRHACIS